uniref:Uncharacterized protein n=1 Tax=viral metagenome TaxID=1070528 RepID=A0A6C0IZW9_9ZZZZ
MGVHMCDPTGGPQETSPSLFGSCFFSKVKKRKKEQSNRPPHPEFPREGYTCVTH